MKSIDSFNNAVPYESDRQLAIELAWFGYFLHNHAPYPLVSGALFLTGILLPFDFNSRIVFSVIGIILLLIGYFLNQNYKKEQFRLELLQNQGAIILQDLYPDFFAVGLSSLKNN